MVEFPVFRWLQTDEVKSVFGEDVRVYPYDSAPHSDNLELPYCVYAYISGVNEPSLQGNTGVGGHRYQFDVYASSGKTSRDAAGIIERALGDYGYTVSYNIRERDPVTKNYRISFDMEFFADGH